MRKEPSGADTGAGDPETIAAERGSARPYRVTGGAGGGRSQPHRAAASSTAAAPATAGKARRDTPEPPRGAAAAVPTVGRKAGLVSASRKARALSNRSAGSFSIDL